MPSRGQITISGAGIRTVRRAASKAETIRIKLSLRTSALRDLEREHKVTLKLRVAYVPAGGSASFAAVRLTFLPAHRHPSRHGRVTPRRTHDVGGAR